MLCPLGCGFSHSSYSLNKGAAKEGYLPRLSPTMIPYIQEWDMGALSGGFVGLGFSQDATELRRREGCEKATSSSSPMPWEASSHRLLHQSLVGLDLFRSLDQRQCPSLHLQGTGPLLWVRIWLFKGQNLAPPF